MTLIDTQTPACKLVESAAPSRTRSSWALLRKRLLGSCQILGVLGALLSGTVQAQPVQPPNPTQAGNTSALTPGDAGSARSADAAPAIAAPAPAVATEAPAPAAASSSAPATRSGIWWSGASASLDPQQELRELARLEPPRPMAGEESEHTYSYLANFQDDLYMQTDLVLPGIQSVQTITFPRPRQWNLVNGCELRLLVEHSSALIAERSHLTISLNDVTLQSFKLDAANIAGGEIRIPLPIALLQDYNKIKLEVQQHYTSECEDPFDPALWTKVSRNSSILFNYQYRPVSTDLALYPAPFFDRLGYGYTVLRYVMPQRASAQTLQALGLISGGMGREISYGHAAIAEPLQSLDESKGHTILVGTPQENPEIARLLGNKLGSLGPNQGVLAIVRHPRNPALAVLVVTGGSADGVLKAALALSSPRRKFATSGDFAIITEAESDSPSRIREREGFLPETAGFDLKELGFKDTTVKGFFASPIRIDLRTMPDVRFFERMLNLRLYYSYGAQQDMRLSTLEVRWNNITIQSVALDNPEGETRAELNISIPEEIVTPYNTLQFVFHLLPTSYNPCGTKVDHQLWGTIFSDSHFEMPRYNYAEMPDLGKMQFGMYPYGLYQDLAETLLVLPDNPDANDLTAAAAAALELGRNTSSRRISLRIMQANDVSPELRGTRDLIVIQTGRQNSFLESVADGRVLSALVDKKILRGDKGTLLQVSDLNTLGVLEQFVSPFASNRMITVVQGSTPDTLRRALRMMFDIRLLSQLTGDIAVISAENKVESHTIRSQVGIGVIPLLVQLRMVGRNYPWLVVGMLLAALFVLYGVLKVMLALYRRKNHSGVGGDPNQGGDESDPDDSGPNPGAPPAGGPAPVAGTRAAVPVAAPAAAPTSAASTSVSGQVPPAPQAPAPAPALVNGNGAGTRTVRVPPAAAPVAPPAPVAEAVQEEPAPVPPVPARRLPSAGQVPDSTVTRRRPRPGRRSEDEDGNP